MHHNYCHVICNKSKAQTPHVIENCNNGIYFDQDQQYQYFWTHLYQLLLSSEMEVFY